MPRWTMMAACVWLLAVLPRPLHALDFKVFETDEGERYLYASGPIGDGDADKVLELLSDGLLEERRVILDSPGGDLFEGQMLGNVFNIWGFETIVASDGKCYSACFFAYSGGEYRWVERGGRLGVHQFRGGPDDAANTQFITGLLAKSFDNWGVGPGALARALQTSADRIHVFTRDELHEYNLLIDSGGVSFIDREAAALKISADEYVRRRKNLLGSKKLRDCNELEGVARDYCTFLLPNAFGLRR